MKDFYIKLIISDWMNDPKLGMCSPATRGIWMDIICAMTIDNTSEITGTIEQLAMISRCNYDEMKIAVDDLKNTKTATVTNRNGKITLKSRRINREQKTKENNRIRQKKYKEKHTDNTKVTPESQNSNNVYSYSYKIIDKKDKNKIIPLSDLREHAIENATHVILLKNSDGWTDDDVIIPVSRFQKWQKLFQHIELITEIGRITEIMIGNPQKIENVQAYIYAALTKAEKEAVRAKTTSGFTRVGGIRSGNPGKYQTGE